MKNRVVIYNNIVLVKSFNPGFEAGGQNIPSNILPWSIIGDESSIHVVTDRSSCFERNKIALKMEVLCESNGCPSQGVGVYNPGYWGMVQIFYTLYVTLHFSVCYFL